MIETPVKFVPELLASDPESPLVRIVVNPDTFDLTVIPTVLHVQSGKPVRWTVVEADSKGNIASAEGASILLTFRDAKAVQQVDPERACTFPVNTIRGSANRHAGIQAGDPGRYHYKVMVSYKDKIFADVGCPSMEIRPR